MSDIVNRLNALHASGADPQPTAEDAPADERTEQDEQQADTLQSDTESPIDRRRKVKLGDKEVEFEILTDDQDLIDAVPKSLLMQADYTKKTMEVSEQKKAADEKLSKLNEAIKELEDSLALDVEDLESQEMLELKEYDPEAYLKVFEKARKKAERLEKHKKNAFDRNQKLAEESAKKEIDLWVKSVPDWLDDNVKSKELKEMALSLKTAGFSDEEMSGFYDHRLISMLRKAMLYDKIKSQKIEATSKKSAVPKTMSSTAKTADTGDNTLYQQSRQKLKSSGKISDAQAAIQKLIGG